jgi:hypothetical protein
MSTPFHEKKADKVAFVGFSTTTRHLAPFDLDTFEIWGVNNIYAYVPRIDVLFELHDKHEALTVKRHKDHYNWLKNEAKKQNIPVYMLAQYTEVPTSIAYPIKEIRAEFGDFFTTSIGYMLALAILMEYKEIHLYGIGAGDDAYGEYIDQRENIAYYVGLARGRGIFVYIPPIATICKAPFLYGYENTNMAKRMCLDLKRYAQMRKGSNEEEARKYSSYANQYIGEMRAYDNILAAMKEAADEPETICPNCMGLGRVEDVPIRQS